MSAKKAKKSLSSKELRAAARIRAILRDKIKQLDLVELLKGDLSKKGIESANRRAVRAIKSNVLSSCVGPAFEGLTKTKINLLVSHSMVTLLADALEACVKKETEKIAKKREELSNSGELETTAKDILFSSIVKLMGKVLNGYSSREETIAETKKAKNRVVDSLIKALSKRYSYADLKVLKKVVKSCVNEYLPEAARFYVVKCADEL